MKRNTLSILGCPLCYANLTLAGQDLGVITSGKMICPNCQKNYPIVGGIPYFIEIQTLSGYNHRFSRLYDWFSWIYAAFSKVAFAYIDMDEETGRREITDRLQPNGGSVLEVSIGSGVNLPYLMSRVDVGEVFGLDISLGQLKRCQHFMAKKGWDVDLFLGNGEQLPFQDEAFEGVFHVGGINFFNNKKAAIDEMIRVAKPGAKILIADESEKGAQGYDKFIPGFKNSFGGKRKEIVAPMGLVPNAMQERKLFDVWKGWMYCIEFVKPYGVEAE